MSSLFKVPLTTITQILPHNNADSLELAIVYGFVVVVKKDVYNVGDKVLYVPIDSIINKGLEDYLFPEGSKIKLDGGRVKQIRIRKAASQGMLIEANDPFIINMAKEFTKKKNFEFKLEEDYSKVLNIVKYNPPERGVSFSGGAPSTSKKRSNPLFKTYGGISALKWYPDVFKDGEQVYITEKIHGTNARAGLLPTVAISWMDRIKKVFGLLPKYRFYYGSNNVDISSSFNYKGYYGEDVYGKCFKQYGLDKILKPGEIVYGEIYGSGIQKNYNYGCKDEHKLILFDVRVVDGDGNLKYLDVEEFKKWTDERNLPRVPELYTGPWNYELAKSLTLGASVLAPEQKVREGVVVKSMKEEVCSAGRKCLKLISEVYLDDKNNTDFN